MPLGGKEDAGCGTRYDGWKEKKERKGGATEKGKVG